MIEQIDRADRKQHAQHDSECSRQNKFSSKSFACHRKSPSPRAMDTASNRFGELEIGLPKGLVPSAWKCPINTRRLRTRLGGYASPALAAAAYKAARIKARLAAKPLTINEQFSAVSEAQIPNLAPPVTSRQQDAVLMESIQPSFSKSVVQMIE